MKLELGWGCGVIIYERADITKLERTRYNNKRFPEVNIKKTCITNKGLDRILLGKCDSLLF